jgi:hypothetical protein
MSGSIRSVGGAAANAGTAQPVSPAAESRVRQIYQREAARFSSPQARLQSGERYDAIVLEDSRCPQGVVCFWAGQLVTAHVGQSTGNIWFEVAGAGNARFYGPFGSEAPARKVLDIVLDREPPVVSEWDTINLGVGWNGTPRDFTLDGTTYSVSERLGSSKGGAPWSKFVVSLPRFERPGSVQASVTLDTGEVVPVTLNLVFGL